MGIRRWSFSRLTFFFLKFFLFLYTFFTSRRDVHAYPTSVPQRSIQRKRR